MTQASRRKGGLGRGLASLIPTGPTETGGSGFGPKMGDAAADIVLGTSSGRDLAPVGAVYLEIDPELIVPNPRQPRQAFDEEALAELVHSIRGFGLMEPVVVRTPDSRGRDPLAPLTAGGTRDDPRDRARDKRRQHVARRVAGKHPPRPTEPVGRSRRLPA